LQDLLERSPSNQSGEIFSVEGRPSLEKAVSQRAVAKGDEMELQTYDCDSFLSFSRDSVLPDLIAGKLRDIRRLFAARVGLAQSSRLPLAPSGNLERPEFDLSFVSSTLSQGVESHRCIKRLQYEHQTQLFLPFISGRASYRVRTMLFGPK
jgi:hypothetical protein